MAKCWKCDVCGKPIRGATGYVTIAGRQGGYPVPINRPKPSLGVKSLAERIRLGEIVLDPNVVLRVMHAGCDPDPDTGEYWFGVERAASLEAWVAWAAHLAQKTWMGGYETRIFLDFWFKNRGESMHALM